MQAKKTSIAIKGEELAAEFLKKSGYEILFRNWRCSNIGEIDIIAQKDFYVVFFEVKTRTSDACGDPLESIHRRKQRQLVKLANIFLSQNSFPPKINYRFDAIGIILGHSPTINHIENAFTDEYRL